MIDLCSIRFRRPGTGCGLVQFCPELAASLGNFEIVTPKKAGRFEARSFLQAPAYKRCQKRFPLSSFGRAVARSHLARFDTFQNTAYSSISMISSRIPCAFLKSSTARLQ